MTAAQKRTLRSEPKMAALMLRGQPELIAARNFYKTQMGDGNWTPDNEFHVTMVYLPGEEKHPKLPKVKSEPVPLNVEGVALWDTDNGNKALVLEVEGTPPLKAVQNELYTHYATYETSPYSTPDDWKPHITLGYVSEDAELPADLGNFQMTGKRLELVQGDKVLSRKMLRYPRDGDKMAYDVDGNINYFGESKLTQLEASYDPLGGDDFEACANCRWFQGQRCQVVNGNISPTGYSELYMPVDFPGLAVPDIELGFMARLKSFFNSPVLNGPSGFKVISDKRWIAWYSNAYEDKDGELFATAALQRDADYITKSGDYPELWFYHIPGTKHGRADWIGLVGRFMVATGTFDDSELARALQKTYKGETVSHGFVYNENSKVDGIYYDFHTFEISPTPQGAEANPLTRFEVKTVDDRQKEELAKRVGPELAQSILALGEEATQKADGSGVRFKSKDESSEELQKAQNPAMEELRADMQAMQATLSKTVEVLTLMASKQDMDEDEEDEEEDDKEDMDDEKSKLPDRLPEGLRAALLADLEKNQQFAAREQKLEGLAGVDQMLAHVFPKMYGVD